MRLCLSVLSIVLLANTAWGQSYQRFSVYSGPVTSNYDRYFTKYFWPSYPEKALALHKKGKGVYRLKIDQQSGKVIEIKVLKSTGVKSLDDAAALALSQWKAKPHVIQSADVPVEFTGPGESIGSHISW